MKNLLLLTTLFLSIFISSKTYSQCGTLPDLNPWLNDDPLTEGVGVFIETSGGVTFAGTAFSGQTNSYEIDLSEVTEVIFATVCRGGNILTQGSSSFVGSLPCTETFECLDDVHFYTSPTISDPYNYPFVNLGFEPFFGSAPTVTVQLMFSGCGLASPLLTAPTNEEENTGTSVLLNWDAVPQAVDYEVRIIEACNGCPSASFTTSNTQQSVSVNANSSYFWQVRATGAGTCQSAWSTSHFWSGAADPMGVAVCNFFDEGRWTSSGPVTSDWPILVLENVVFCSNISVTLNPGFEVGTGGSLVISTDGCD